VVRARPTGYLLLAVCCGLVPATGQILPPVQILREEVYSAPAGLRPAARRAGASILPGGRVVAPYGEEYPIGPGAFGLAISPSGRTVVTANSGPVRYSLTILERAAGARWQARQLVVRPPDNIEPRGTGWSGVSMGLAFTSDHGLFASEGNSGRIASFDASDDRGRAVDLNRQGYQDSYTGDLAIDPQRNILYAVDQANFRVAVVDIRSRQVIASVKVGRLPFALALSPDCRRLFVTNLGSFEYHQLPGGSVPFPPFGFPSAQALAALGDPNAEASQTLAIVDVAHPAAAKVEAFVHTGVPVGGDIAGGSSPSGIAVGAGRVFVANAANDSVSVVDPETRRVEAEIPMRIPGLEAWRGVVPLGMAYHERSGWLLVAEAGINAVAVIDVRQRRLLGHIPAAWFPTRVAALGDTVFVANARGHGVGPNAPDWVPESLHPGLAGRFLLPGYLYQGTLSVFRLPAAEELPALTRTALEAAGLTPRAAPPSLLPQAGHVVLIVKESRAYDEILGDISGAANGPAMGDPELAIYGEQGLADGQRRRLSIKQANLSPNHHAIARQWAFSDNFYSDAEGSVDGHHWLVGAYPNAWVESSARAAYGGQKDFRLSPAAGRLSFAGLASSVQPEDEPEAGAIWHHLARHGVSFFNFGEGFELAGIREGPDMQPTGARFSTDMPMPEPLYRNTSHDYPGFNPEISDRFRATQFIDEIERRYLQPKAELPRFLYIQLPGDFTPHPHPSPAYPYTASYIADNDYALGRILEFLSHTPWWRDMVVFVTEADAQDGIDHIDAHRTVLLVAGPSVKRNYVSHTNSSFPGLLKTIFELLRLPPLNLFDAVASDLGDCFTEKADPAAYQARPPDKRVFVP
jgi:YVTN family beta-propeller protein